jgi:CRISPR-associated endonuclease/helicase Cas3
MKSWTNLLWAKSSPEKTLVSHMIDSGIFAKNLCQQGILNPAIKLISKYLSLDFKQTIQFVSYYVAMHDIGKCHPDFQFKDSSSQISKQFLAEGNAITIFNSNFRHEQYSETICVRILQEKYGVGIREAKLLSKPLSMHHQGKQSRMNLASNSKANSLLWKGCQDELEEIAKKVFEVPPLGIIHLRKCNHVDAVCTLLVGAIILCDWLASAIWFEEIDIDFLVPDAIAAYAQRIFEKTKAIISECGLDIASLPNTQEFSSFWPQLVPSSLRPVQKEISRIFSAKELPILTIIEAPMGEGKTEAGVYAASQMATAYGKQGLYVALPTSATSTQMYQRLSQLLLEHDLPQARLLHSMAWLIDDKTLDLGFMETEGKSGTGLMTVEEKEALLWMAPLRRGLLSSFAVGTIDQAMYSVLAIRYGVLRLLGLSGKALIIDEIHAYDAYMSDIIELLLKWCRELAIPVVMLSATIPSSKKQQFCNCYGKTAGPLALTYPLITTIGNDGQISQHDVAGTYMKSSVELSLVPLLGIWGSVANLALEKIAYGGVLCIIVNTVFDAQTLYQRVKEQVCSDSEIETLLFHSRFTAEDRCVIESRCIEMFGKNSTCRPRKAILIATQVVEQSLDVDFDVMISTIAPVDLILQRVGRLHRHAETKRNQLCILPRLTILVPSVEGEFGINQWVYPPLLLERTLDVLRGIQRLELPKDIRQLVENVYDFSKSDEAIVRQWKDVELYRNQIALERSSARQFELRPPSPCDFTMPMLDCVFNDDSSAHLVAKTRLSEPSMTLAILSRELYTRAQCARPNKELARTILKHTISIPLRNLGENPDEGFFPIISGNGLLGNVFLTCFEEGRFGFKEGKVTGYAYDSKLGLKIFKKEGKNGNV